MTQTKGYAALSAHAPLVPWSFERREPQDHDVEIKIQYCGICHSDVHQVKDEWGRSAFPMVPGHEITGIVSRVGKATQGFAIGDRVGVGCMIGSCRHCASCQEGLEQYCAQGMRGTYNSLEADGVTLTYGGYSERIVVHQDFVLKIPSNLPLDQAAPLLCAGITVYSPLRHWQVGAGKKLAVLGLGGLGHMAVKIGHAMGAEVTVLSHSRKKEADALRLGAQAFCNTTETHELEKLRSTFDFILCTVSEGIDWNTYLGLLKREGTLIIVGAPGNPVPVSASALISGRRQIAGSLIGGIKETQEMLQFCSKHALSCDIEKISASEINTAYQRMLKSDVRYRFVIDLATL